MLRVGRNLENETGLLFLALVRDIERQFEFVQQSWLNSDGFGGAENETDPLLGPEGRSFTVPTPGGPVSLGPLPRFVRSYGGGYFFVPGKDTLRWLQGR